MIVFLGSLFCFIAWGTPSEEKHHATKKHVIIGGGVSGLFLAKSLVSKINPHSLVILERGSKWGGKINSQVLDTGEIRELGAGRFNQSIHPRVSSLIQDLQLDVEPFKYKYTISLCTNKQKKLVKMSEYIKQKWSLTQLSYGSFKQWLTTVLKKSDADAFVEATGYDVFSLDELPPEEGIRILHCHPETAWFFDHENKTSNEWLRVSPCMGKLIECLVNELTKLGVSLLLDSEVDRVVFDRNMRVEASDGRNFDASAIYLTLGKCDTITLLKQSGFKDIQISGNDLAVPLMKGFFTYKSSLTNEARLALRNKCFVGGPYSRKIYLGEWGAVVYLDSRSATDANENKEYFVARVKEELSGCLQNHALDDDILDETSFEAVYYDEGVLLWEGCSGVSDEGLTSTLGSRHMELDAFGKKMFWVSDIFSSSPGWIEGCLESVESLMYLLEEEKI